MINYYYTVKFVVTLSSTVDRQLRLNYDWANLTCRKYWKGELSQITCRRNQLSNNKHNFSTWNKVINVAEIPWGRTVMFKRVFPNRIMPSVVEMRDHTLQTGWSTERFLETYLWYTSSKIHTSKILFPSQCCLTLLFQHKLARAR